MRKISVEIDGIEYIGNTAPAKDQVEMLQIAAQTGLMPVVAPDVSDFSILAAVATVNAGFTARLAELCLVKGDIKRDGVPVAENLFQDEAHGYLLLIGKVLRENIGPFWKLNSNENAANGTETAPKAG